MARGELSVFLEAADQGGDKGEPRGAVQVGRTLFGGFGSAEHGWAAKAPFRVSESP